MLRSAKAGRTGQGTYTLESLPDGGTRVAFEYRWLVAPRADRLLAPLVRSYLRRNNHIAMRRLAEQPRECHYSRHPRSRVLRCCPVSWSPVSSRAA